MNKLKIFAYVALASFSILSCRDAIDIVQDGEITQEVAFKETSDLRRFLVGNVYGSINIENEIALTSYFTDEVAIARSNTGWYLKEFRYDLFSDNSYVSNTWISHYNTIDKVNRLIELSATISPDTASQAEYNSILSEAKAIRALSYITLLSYFSTDMKDDNALGVMLSTEKQSITAKLPRVANGEIYKLIDEDLQFAEDNLLSTATDYKYVTKALVYALRARVNAYRGIYNDVNGKYGAIHYAKEAIKLAPALANAPGTTRASMPYSNMWSDSVQGEVIFALSRPVAGSWSEIAARWTTNTTNLSGSAQMGMSHKLYSLYGNRDIRRIVFVDATSDDNNKIIDKYPGKGNRPLRNDIKVFRTSELYFILAEGYIHNGQLELAAEQLKKVRDARLYGGTQASLPTYANKVEAYKDLLLERRLELCFEGHRYVDLRRLGALAGVSIDRNVKDDYILSSTPLTLPITDHRFTYPIPQSEILGNPEIAKQQNPNY